VQIDSNGPDVQSRQELTHVKPVVVDHPQGEIHDTHLQTLLAQIAEDREKSDRIHLEHSGRRHHVAHGAVQNRVLPEVVHAGSVQQQQICFRARAHLSVGA